MNIAQRTISLLGVLALAGVPLAASADGVPSYATGASGNEETIQGQIQSIDGQYTIRLEDVRGFVDSVTLHDGTVINPNGTQLAAGQDVTIVGHANGRTFEAVEIDLAPPDDSGASAAQGGYGPSTSYESPAYYDGDAYPYPYPVYPVYPYPYWGYPGAVSVGFFFGGHFFHGFPNHNFPGHGFAGHGFATHTFSGRTSFGAGSGRAALGRSFSSSASRGFSGGGGHSSGGGHR